MEEQQCCPRTLPWQQNMSIDMGSAWALPCRNCFHHTMWQMCTCDSIQASIRQRRCLINVGMPSWSCCDPQHCKLTAFAPHHQEFIVIGGSTMFGFLWVEKSFPQQCLVSGFLSNNSCFRCTNILTTTVSPASQTAPRKTREVGRSCKELSGGTQHDAPQYLRFEGIASNPQGYFGHFVSASAKVGCKPSTVMCIF